MNHVNGYPYPTYGYPFPYATAQVMPAYYPVGQYYTQQRPYESSRRTTSVLQDHGGKPYVVDIEDAAEDNRAYRTALWTGNHLQVTLMSIDVGDDIGLEVHNNTDQFLRIEDGHGVVRMGSDPQQLNFVQPVDEDTAIFVPAGTWHNVQNTGNTPLKLYSIYAPPHHPFGTVEQTKSDSHHT